MEQFVDQQLRGGLIAAVRVLESGKKFDLATVGEGLALFDFRGRFGDGTFAAIPKRHGDGDAGAIGGIIGFPVDFGAQEWLRAALRHLIAHPSVGTAYFGLTKRQRRVAFQDFASQIFKRRN